MPAQGNADGSDPTRLTGDPAGDDYPLVEGPYMAIAVDRDAYFVNVCGLPIR